jgi:hypothetical protein
MPVLREPAALFIANPWWTNRQFDGQSKTLPSAVDVDHMPTGRTAGAFSVGLNVMP